MYGLDRATILKALTRPGELASGHETKIHLVLLGGAAMALRYNNRYSTKDVDVVVRLPEERKLVWLLAGRVAEESTCLRTG